MRRILVDQARRRKAAKWGGGAEREELHEWAIVTDRPVEELLAVDELLDRLAEVDPTAAKLVKLRFSFAIDQTNVGVVHERSSLQRLSRFLLGEPNGSKLPELLISTGCH